MMALQRFGHFAAILLPQPGHLAHVSANDSALLEPESASGGLTGRLGTQHH